MLWFFSRRMAHIPRTSGIIWVVSLCVVALFNCNDIKPNISALPDDSLQGERRSEHTIKPTVSPKLTLVMTNLPVIFCNTGSYFRHIKVASSSMHVGETRHRGGYRFSVSSKTHIGTFYSCSFSRRKKVIY